MESGREVWWRNLLAIPRAGAPARQTKGRRDGITRRLGTMGGQQVSSPPRLSISEGIDGFKSFSYPISRRARCLRANLKAYGFCSLVGFKFGLTNARVETVSRRVGLSRTVRVGKRRLLRYPPPPRSYEGHPLLSSILLCICLESPIAVLCI